MVPMIFTRKLGGLLFFENPKQMLRWGSSHRKKLGGKWPASPAWITWGWSNVNWINIPFCFSRVFFLCGYGSIPINTMFSGMNIHKSQLFWCELQGYKVLTHCHVWLILLILSIARVDNMILWSALVWFEDVRMMKHHNYCGHYPHNGQCSTIGFHHFIQICRVDSIRLH